VKKVQVSAGCSKYESPCKMKGRESN